MDLGRRGTGGSGGSLPYKDTLERAFGPAHDLSDIRVHTDAAAVHATGALGARGFALGNAIALSGPPELHLIAHEVAHVLQQRHGIQIPGGLGSANDTYEHHADAVADRIVAGQPVHDLLPGQPAGDAALGQRGPTKRQESTPLQAQLQRKEPGDDELVAIDRILLSWSRKFPHGVELKAELKLSGNVLADQSGAPAGPSESQLTWLTVEYQPWLDRQAAVKVATLEDGWEIGPGVSLGFELNGPELSDEEFNAGAVSGKASLVIDKSNLTRCATRPDYLCAPLAKKILGTPGLAAMFEIGLSLELELSVTKKIEPGDLARLNQLRGMSRELRQLEKETEALTEVLRQREQQYTAKLNEFLAQQEHKLEGKTGKQRAKALKKLRDKFARSVEGKALKAEKKSALKQLRQLGKKSKKLLDKMKGLGSRMTTKLGKRLGAKVVKQAFRTVARLAGKVLIVLQAIDTAITVIKLIQYWEGLHLFGEGTALDDLPIIKPEDSQTGGESALGGEGAEPGEEAGADHEADSASEGSDDTTQGPDDDAQGDSQGITQEAMQRLSAAPENVQRLWQAVTETAVLPSPNLMRDEHLERFLAMVPADIRPEEVERITSQLVLHVAVSPDQALDHLQQLISEEVQQRSGGSAEGSTATGSESPEGATGEKAEAVAEGDEKGKSSSVVPAIVIDGDAPKGKTVSAQVGYAIRVLSPAKVQVGSIVTATVFVLYVDDQDGNQTTLIVADRKLRVAEINSKGIVLHSLQKFSASSEGVGPLYFKPETTIRAPWESVQGIERPR